MENEKTANKIESASKPAAIGGESGALYEELKRKYPSDELMVLTSEFIDDDRKEVSVEIVCKKPQAAAINRFMKDMMQKPHKALLNLVLDVIVHPSKDKFRQLCEQYPGIAASIGGELTEGAGFGADVVRKKL